MATEAQSIGVLFEEEQLEVRIELLPGTVLDNCMDVHLIRLFKNFYYK